MEVEAEVVGMILKVRKYQYLWVKIIKVEVEVVVVKEG